MMYSKKKIQADKMEFICDVLDVLDLDIVDKSPHTVSFLFKGYVVKYNPLKEWASGRTIKDGRGVKNLIKQLVKI